MRTVAFLTALALAIAPALAQGRVADLKRELKQRERAAKSDADALIEVAKWAQQHGLTSDKRRILENVLKAAPDNETAHRLLGHVQFEGAWTTAEDAATRRAESRAAEFKEKGWTKVAGVWVEPEHVDDAKNGVFWDSGRRVSRSEKLAFNAGMVRHPRTGQLIDPSDLEKANAGLFPLDDGRWVDESEADKYHAQRDRPWIYRATHLTLVSHKPIEQVGELAADVDSGYEVASRIFVGAEPSPDHRPVVVLADDDEDYRQFGTAVGAEGSAYSVFYAEGAIDIPGLGEARPAICNWNTNWIRYWIRHAAAFAYVESLLGECGIEAPLWFRRGVAGYGERFFDPDIAAWFGQQFLQAGGLKRLDGWFDDFAIHGGLEWQQMDASVFQAGLLLSYAMNGGDADAAAALQEVAQAVQAKDNRGAAKAISKLEKLLTRSESKVRQYLGQLTQKSG